MNYGENSHDGHERVQEKVNNLEEDDEEIKTLRLIKKQKKK